MMYPVLTIRQPWAWLILQDQLPELRKDIENRDWKLPEQYLNTPVLIHTSQSPKFNSEIDEFACAQFLERGLMSEEPTLHMAMGDDIEGCALSGHIVGVVRFSKCIPNPAFDLSKDSQALVKAASPWCDPDSKFWWKIEKALPITPVPAKGKLRFWKFNYPHPEKLEGV